MKPPASQNQVGSEVVYWEQTVLHPIHLADWAAFGLLSSFFVQDMEVPAFYLLFIYLFFLCGTGSVYVLSYLCLWV